MKVSEIGGKIWRENSYEFWKSQDKLGFDFVRHDSSSGGGDDSQNSNMVVEEEKIHRPNWSSSSCTSKRLRTRCRWIWIWKWTSSATKTTGNCLQFPSPPSKQHPRGSSRCHFKKPNLQPPPLTKTTVTQYDTVLAAMTTITTATTTTTTTTTTMTWWCGHQMRQFRGNRACWERKLSRDWWTRRLLKWKSGLVGCPGRVRFDSRCCRKWMTKMITHFWKMISRTIQLIQSIAIIWY